MLIAIEGFWCHIVQLVVVEVAEVVEQLHRALVSFNELVVGPGHDGVFDQVTLYLVLLLDGIVLVSVGILGTIQGVLGDGSGILVSEVLL